MALLSIVTPVFNRASLLRRTIDSVRRQDHPDWEMIIVDDGSHDDCAAVVRSYGDPRLTLLRHERNRGVSPARNTGVTAARGEWIVLLDSDDELARGALATIHRRSLEVAPEVGRLGFMYRVAEGGFSPEPPLVESTWDYEGYIRWAASLCGRSDFSNCIRRSTFCRLRFADDRSFESLYHLDFAKLYTTRTYPDVVAITHADAANRSSNLRISNLMASARDNARARDTLLERHGQALLRLSPARFAAELRAAAINHLLAGQRLAAGRQVYQLCRLGSAASSLPLLAMGLAGARPFAAAMVVKARLRALFARRRSGL